MKELDMCDVSCGPWSGITGISGNKQKSDDQWRGPKSWRLLLNTPPPVLVGQVKEEAQSTSLLRASRGELLHEILRMIRVFLKPLGLFLHALFYFQNSSRFRLVLEGKRPLVVKGQSTKRKHQHHSRLLHIRPFLSTYFSRVYH